MVLFRTMDEELSVDGLSLVGAADSPKPEPVADDARRNEQGEPLLLHR